MRFVYRRISGADLRDALNRIGIGPKTFARVFGVNPKVVKRWLADKQDIAPWVPIALTLLGMPGAIGRAKLAAAALIAEDKEHPDRGRHPYMEGRSLPEWEDGEDGLPPATADSPISGYG